MIPEYPSEACIPQLRELWKLSFGDDDSFLDSFFSTGYSPDRCRCVLCEGQVAAALYWFDCRYEDRDYAYLYAVATHPDFRRRGIIHYLIADTHRLLSDRGYAGVLLVPGDEGLRKLYASMGYRDCTTVSQFVCSAQATDVVVHPIDLVSYRTMRKKLLPKDGVLQENENLTFLETQARFYGGPDFVLCAAPKTGDTLEGIEYLGDPAVVPGILSALGFGQGCFQTPGTKLPYAMLCPLKADAPVPGYFGLSFN